MLTVFCNFRRRINPIIMRTIVFSLALMLISEQAYTQACSMCTIDYTYISAGVYPDTLPPATAGEFYEADITFVMQEDTTVDVVGTLEFLNYYIMEPVGMPYGMSVSTNIGDLPVNYDPDVSLYGCARVCGTPLVPGWYEVVVPLIATLEYPGGDQAAEYSLFLEVLPAVDAGGGIIATETFGCEPVSVDFETSMHSFGDPGFTYTWDFGNGSTSTNEFPPSQTYTAVGGLPTDYVITHTVTIDTFGYTLAYATALASGCDDCTIFGCTGLVETEKPDLYIRCDALGINTEPGFADTYPPVTFSLGVPLDPGATYTMQMKDDDGGLAGSDDNCGNFMFGGDDVGTTVLTSGSHQLEISITHPIISYTFYDTITVYPGVATPVITVTGETVFCSGDSVILSTDAVAGIDYQWHVDGSPIPGEDGASIDIFTSGTYFLTATGAGGCSATSSETAIEMYEQPTAPNILVIAGTTLTTSSTWDVQWYYEGSAIPGATSTTYTPALEGTYQVAAINGPCVAFSVEIEFVFQSITLTSIQSLTVQPNPNTGTFSCLYTLATAQAIEYQVTNMLGEIVYSTTIQHAGGQIRTYLDLGNVVPGIYQLHLRASDGQLIRQIVVQ